MGIWDRELMFGEVFLMLHELLNSGEYNNECVEHLSYFIFKIFKNPLQLF